MTRRHKMPRQDRTKSKQDYATPKPFIMAVLKRLKIESFAFDFAADATNAKAVAYWNEEDDSLSKTPEEWLDHLTIGGRHPKAWGWLNPPFAEITPWAFGCSELRRVGGQVAFLVPAGVSTRWYASYVHPYAQVWGLTGRMSFLEKGAGDQYPKDLILALYAPHLKPSFGVWDWRR